jgi:hypothetical protein
MTRKLEETFDIPHDDGQVEENFEEDIENSTQTASEIMSALTSVEKIDVALSTVEDLSAYNDEMDEISRKALDAYKDLLILGMNSPVGNAGRLLEVANMMLRTALDARSNKAANKLKTIELQIRKARLDADMGEVTGAGMGLSHRDMVDYIKEISMTPKPNDSDDKNTNK